MRCRNSIALVVLACAGCDSLANDIRGTDSGALLPTARVLAPIVEFQAARDIDDGGRRRIEPLLGIELAGDYVQGDFNQDGTGFATDYEMWQGSAAVRGGFRVDRVIRLEALGGVGWHDVELDFVNITTPVNRAEDGFGLIIGVQGIWEPVDRLGLYARATAMTIPADSTSVLAEAGLTVRVVDRLHALVGFRHWRYRYEGDGALRSDIDLKVNGLLVGAELRF